MAATMHLYLIEETSRREGGSSLEIGNDLGNLRLNALFLCGSANLELSEPLSLLGVRLDKLRCSLDLIAHRGLLLCGGLPYGVGSDLSVGCFVDLIDASALEELLPLAELLTELSGLLGLQQVVVLLHVDAQDMLEVLLSAEIRLRLLLLFLTAALLAANVHLGPH